MRALGSIAAILTACAFVWQQADNWFPVSVDRETSRIVSDADGLPLRIFPVEDGRWRLAAERDAIDERFVEALLLIEDERFFDHRGVDGLAVLRAARDNLTRGEVVSGASTITMQTVRLLEPRPRTMRSKLIEMLRARQLERMLTKTQILELYLSLAPYGGNLEGVRAASWSYFGKAPRQLTDAEIALLIALPQSPEARRPDRRPATATAARRSILQRLAATGFISSRRAEEAASAHLPTARHAFPSDAWHLAERLKGAEDRDVQTHVDRRAQQHLVRLLKAAADEQGPEVQAAGMIVELDSRKVIASVGSVDRARPGGWLDLTNRKRSPGSTLKPFVYGLALQEGIVTPHARVADLPARFGTYEPENFSRISYGELTLAEALQHSLNVPAVMLLDQVGPERLTGTLRHAGVDVHVPQADNRSEGLATALGGLGISLRDLAGLYAALGNDGVVGPLRYQEADTEGTERRILTEEAAGRILGILRRAPGADGRAPAHLTSAPLVAFKTGTSYGYRDAWAVGVGQRHAVVVWIGRADGGARPGATGREVALPVLFDIFDAVERASSATARHSAEAAPSHRTMRIENGPALLFPADGSSLWQRANDRPFLFAARGASPLRWYVNGQIVEADQDGNLAWLPDGEGFYEVTVVDADGLRDTASFRVLTDSS